MLQNTYNAYLRGYEGKPIPAYVRKGTLLYIKYYEGKSDKDNGLPNRYVK